MSEKHLKQQKMRPKLEKMRNQNLERSGRGLKVMDDGQGWWMR
jgi:hypothetical protein